jgi:hypothetical protein
MWHELNQVGGLGLFEHGAKAAMARELGVHRSTVTRDFQVLFSAWDVVECPTCGSLVERWKWERLHELGKRASPQDNCDRRGQPLRDLCIVRLSGGECSEHAG